MKVILEIVKNLFGAGAEFFGWKREREQRANTPEMRANARAAQDVKAVDEARDAVKAADADDIRRKLS